MERNDIRIRKAGLKDLENLFWLLHAECISWDMKQIIEAMDDLYVMTGSDKLIGAACRKGKGDRAQTAWTAIHPMYPEGIMKDVLIKSLACLEKEVSIYTAATVW